jgi:hypothetical protein
MKSIKIIMTMLFLAPSMLCFSQNRTKSETDTTYHKRTTRKTTTIGTTTPTDIIKDTINKENGPILNDNGSISTTGTIDGRSSTGRTDADTLVGYKVKRTKKTIRNDGRSVPDSSRKRKKKQ